MAGPPRLVPFPSRDGKGTSWAHHDVSPRIDNHTKENTMKNRLTTLTITAALATAGMFGVAACSDSGSSDDTTTTQSTDGGQDAGDAAESEAFIADLEAGVKIINDQIAKVGDMPQIMLASDVDNPTQKYGMWVMPYYPSDAVEKYISTVQIEDGSFVVTATSADTGKQWQMDQDGNLSEAGE